MGFINFKYLYIFYLSIVIGGGEQRHISYLLCNGICSIKTCCLIMWIEHKAKRRSEIFPFTKLKMDKMKPFVLSV